MLERLNQLLFLPAALFGAAYLVTPLLDRVPVSYANVVSQGPAWALLGIGLLSLVFNRGKSLLTAALVGVTTILIPYYSHPLVNLILLGLIPINLALISLYHERGLWSISGLMRPGIILVQGIGLFFAAQNPTVLQWLLDLGYVHFLVSEDDWPAFIPASEVVTLMALVSLVPIIAVPIFRTNPISQSIFAASIGTLLITWVSMPDTMFSSFCFAIAILLASGLIRDYHNMAYRDELTGLPQRRALNEHLLSLGGKYTLAMLDVDHFKKFNDTHGHDVGDQVLQLVAAQIRKTGGGGKAYRYGGEEFTVVFSGKDAEAAAYQLDLVRQNIQNYEMVIRKAERDPATDKQDRVNRERGSYRKAAKSNKVSVTISIGVAEKQDRGETPEEVLKRADQALYKAKRGGRNQVAIENSNRNATPLTN